MERWIPNHWTAREILNSIFKKSQLESGESGMLGTSYPHVSCPKHTVSQWASSAGKYSSYFIDGDSKALGALVPYRR